MSNNKSKEENVNVSNQRKLMDISNIIGLIYPRRCPVCDKILRYGYGKICISCRSKLMYIREPRCKKCGKQMNQYEQEYCLDCKKHIHMFQSGVSLLMHTKEVRNSVYAIKYKGRREYIDFYTDEIVRLYKDEIQSWEAEVLIPVPLYWKKKLRRGYNQAEQIAKSLSAKLGISVDKDILRRIKNTRPQKELNDIQRKTNLKNAFSVREDKNTFKKIIIVDDIYTTGSTIDACALALNRHNDKEIFYICISIGSGY